MLGALVQDVCRRGSPRAGRGRRHPYPVFLLDLVVVLPCISVPTPPSLVLLLVSAWLVGLGLRALKPGRIHLRTTVWEGERR